MNPTPKHFTSLSAALDYCDLVDGSIYKFGDIYNVYVNGAPTPSSEHLFWKSAK